VSGNREDPVRTLSGGRYRLLRRHGEDDLGEMWVAEDGRLGRTVMLRKVDRPPSAGPEIVRRMRRLAPLRDDRILAVHDVLVDDDGVWLVTEIIRDGHTLAEVLDESGPLPVAEVARIGASVLGALSAVHRIGMLHNRLTPGHILLARDELGFRRIAVTGFEESTTDVESVASPDSLTGERILGTAQYMAPECIAGRRLGPASDLYSLGAVLYEAVEGRKPFPLSDGGDVIAVADAVLHDAPPAPVRAGPLGPILQSLLAKDPAARPSADVVAWNLMRIDGIAAAEDPDDEGSLVAPAPTMSAPSSHVGLIRPARAAAVVWERAWLIAVVLTVVLVGGLAVYGLAQLDSAWWFAVLWAPLVTVGVINALRRTTTYPTAATPPASWTAPRRGIAFLAGLTDAAVFLRPRTVVPPLPPTRDEYLREAYVRLGPPPDPGPRTAGGAQ